MMHLFVEDRREDKIFFKGVLQKYTHKVISITIPETPQSENELYQWHGIPARSVTEKFYFFT